ncbi:hypothetical protein GPECTOR_20g392 [Gonium pectorale]|uniref:Uncharacterized protein n=1 Tax=Gonium pectorale TaxID=33097 RepID=A0A150GI87_GONPE|nr:hypothetical protein GPECTOR_20g392 [Gonium pectorale]|eukprot:KXZ49538.1 hypothetical protein GPECTOR_20g392 [Gonium pectorale]
MRILYKLGHIRNNIRHGRDPLAGCRIANALQAWLHKVFTGLPDRTGTSHDVAAALEADPEIAPKLDRSFPEFVDMGFKKGKHKVYRYDEQVLQMLQQNGRKRKG